MLSAGLTPPYLLEDGISCHVWYGNTKPHSPAPPGRIDSTQRQFGFRRPTCRRPSAKYRQSCALGSHVGLVCHNAPDSRLAVVRSWCRFNIRGAENLGEQEQNMPPLLISGRAVVARGALRRLVGITSCITRAKLPSPFGGMYWLSSPHATTIRKPAVHKNIVPLGCSPRQQPTTTPGRRERADIQPRWGASAINLKIATSTGDPQILVSTHLCHT